MNEFVFTNSHVDKFVDRFKDVKEDITSAYLSKQYIPGTGKKIVTAQDRRNLMKLVSEAGYARVTGGLVNEEKYSIRMLNDKAEDLYFDPCIFLEPRMGDLPKVDCLGVNPTVYELLIWLKRKMRWLEIYNLLDRYQNGGKIDRKYLQYTWGKDERERILISAKQLICFYRMIKIGWKDIERNSQIVGSEGYSTYNNIFFDILEAEAELSFRKAIAQDQIRYNKRHRLESQISGYKAIGNDLSGEYTEEGAVKAAEELWNLNIEGEFSLLELFASGLWLLDFLVTSDSVLVQEAIKDWIQATEEFRSYQITILNRYRNKPKRKASRRTLQDRIKVDLAAPLVQKYLASTGKN
jgi:hypothetical protein